jgi:hypothetical protein
VITQLVPLANEQNTLLPFKKNYGNLVEHESRNANILGAYMMQYNHRPHTPNY